MNCPTLPFGFFSRIKISVLCSLAILLSATPGISQVITNVWVYSGNQSGSPGSNWNGAGAAAYWRLGGATNAPTNGTVTATTTNYNFYVLTNDGVQLGNGTATTLIRNPYTGSVPPIVTFPGDTLIVMTNTTIRFKNLGGVGTFITGVNYATPTNNFPGNFGFPGIVLDGGCLNNGTSGTAFVIQGTMFAQPGSLSYLNPADTFNFDYVLRGLIFQSQLTGSGAIALLNGASSNAPPQIVPTPWLATNNNFTGEWIVKSGWLQGVGDGTSDGYNSLGTNTAVIYDIDPGWVPPEGGTNANFGFNTNSYFYNGPAVLDMGTNIANCGGTLILTNGGQLYMHGTVIFSNVLVEGVALAPGTYSYLTLANPTTFPSNNFTPSSALFPGQGGTLTIQGSGPAAIPAQITAQPASDILFPGRTAVFKVTGGGSQPLKYSWYKNSTTLLSDGGNISGSSTSTLTVSNVAVTDSGAYSAVVTNAFGTALSSNATLLVVTPVLPYEVAVSNLNPVAYYELNETNNPANGGLTAYDYAGAFNGTYGVNVQNGFDGITGPTPSLGFPGFSTTNEAIQTATATNNQIITSAWNLNTNTVTMVAWVQPTGAETPNSAIIFCRGANTVAGLNFGGTVGSSGTYDLGYTWNNDVQTYSWDSGIYPPQNQWSMVALSVTPTQATVYVMNANGLTSSTHVYPHVVQPFDTNNTTQIGEDSNDAGSGTRAFFGQIDDVSIYNRSLTGDQLASLFYAATSVTNYAPVIGTQPVSTTNVYVGQSFQLFVNAYGSEPLSYQWASGPVSGNGPYTPLNDANGLSGTHTSTLTFQSVTLGQGVNYICIVSNSLTPSGLQSTPATVNVFTPSAPIFNITLSPQQAAGLDWNSAGNWSDGLPAATSAVSEPGSIYEVLAGARLRTPITVTHAIFPGNELLLDGNGVWLNNPGTGTPQGELRTKQTPPLVGPAPVTFPLLVMNGGQIDNGNGGVAEIQGKISVISNAIFYVDSGGGASRPFQIDATLSGSASIEYHDFDASLSGGLYIMGQSNTYTGTWNIVQGLLLGVGSNSLGTNNINIGTAGAFETAYNLTTTNGSLFLAGRMFLTQTNTFYSVLLGGLPLPVGTYTASYLVSNYPTYFPSNWAASAFSPVPFATNAAGALVVLHTPGAAIITPPQSLTLYAGQTAVFSVVAGGSPPISYRWFSNNVPLIDGGGVVGSASNSLSIANIVVADAASYDVVVTNSLSGTTSAVVTLTVLPTQPPIAITLGTVEPSGDDWNTAGQWNDGLGGLPASTTAGQYPGSTYEVLSSGLMRTPAETTITYTNFPGVQLTVDGNGIFAPGGGGNGNEGEIRFKQGQPGVTNYFPLLILNGGQLDNGASPSTLAEISGEVEVVTNSFIYVDSGGGVGRPWQLDCYLTGGGGLFVHDFDAFLSGGVNVTCPTNTFTGTWFVDQGPLEGTALNSLGTNSITVNTNGVLETLYDIHSPNATLSLSNGARVFLHNNDSFGAVNINGTALANGVYSYAQLASAYPTNFPASWTALFTSPFNTASGTIAVGVAGPPPPVTLSYSFAPGNLVLTWSQGVLLQKTNLLASWVTNTTATSPYVVNPTNAQQFFKIQVQ